MTRAEGIGATPDREEGAVMDASLSPSVRTLLVDDTAALRSLIKMTLERSGRFLIVGEAGDGIEAIALARNTQPDLVLLDISMPRMDGMEALPQIREVAPGARVVMLSGFDGQRLGVQAMRLGAAAYLEKGAHPTRLIDELLGLMDGPELQEASMPSNGNGHVSATHMIPPEELMAFVAHEIRSPATVIHGFGETLMTRWDSLTEADRREAVARMMESAAFLQSVIDNMLAMRALDAGALTLHVTTESSEAVMTTMARELEHVSMDHPLEVSVNEELDRMRVDVVRLQQVLTNLVVNAVRFAPPETPIRLSARQEGNEIAIRVIDRGPGIPQAAREEVFTKFVRKDERSPGVGLGLYISRALMGSMGGTILIEDPPDGVGAVMRVGLPAETWS